MFGIRGISIGSILLVVAIAAIFFGTKRLKHMGEDVGAAIKGFKKGLADPEADADKQTLSSAEHRSDKDKQTPSSDEHKGA